MSNPRLGSKGSSSLFIPNKRPNSSMNPHAPRPGPPIASVNSGSNVAGTTAGAVGGGARRPGPSPPPPPRPGLVTANGVAVSSVTSTATPSPSTSTSHSAVPSLPRPNGVAAAGSSAGPAAGSSTRTSSLSRSLGASSHPSVAPSHTPSTYPASTPSPALSAEFHQIFSKFLLLQNLEQTSIATGTSLVGLDQSIDVPDLPKAEADEVRQMWVESMRRQSDDERKERDRVVGELVGDFHRAVHRVVDQVHGGVYDKIIGQVEQHLAAVAPPSSSSAPSPVQNGAIRPTASSTATAGPSTTITAKTAPASGSTTEASQAPPLPTIETFHELVKSAFVRISTLEAELRLVSQDHANAQKARDQARQDREHVKRKLEVAEQREKEFEARIEARFAALESRSIDPRRRSGVVTAAGGAGQGSGPGSSAVPPTGSGAGIPNGNGGGAGRTEDAKRNGSSGARSPALPNGSPSVGGAASSTGTAATATTATNQASGPTWTSRDAETLSQVSKDVEWIKPRLETLVRVQGIFENRSTAEGVAARTQRDTDRPELSGLIHNVQEGLDRFKAQLEGVEGKVGQGALEQEKANEVVKGLRERIDAHESGLAAINEALPGAKEVMERAREREDQTIAHWKEAFVKAEREIEHLNKTCAETARIANALPDPTSFANPTDLTALNETVGSLSEKVGELTSITDLESALLRGLYFFTTNADLRPLDDDDPNIQYLDGPEAQQAIYDSLNDVRARASRFDSFEERFVRMEGTLDQSERKLDNVATREAEICKTLSDVTSRLSSNMRYVEHIGTSILPRLEHFARQLDLLQAHALLPVCSETSQVQAAAASTGQNSSQLTPQPRPPSGAGHGQGQAQPQARPQQQPQQSPPPPTSTQQRQYPHPQQYQPYAVDPPSRPSSEQSHHAHPPASNQGQVSAQYQPTTGQVGGSMALGYNPQSAQIAGHQLSPALAIWPAQALGQSQTSAQGQFTLGQSRAFAIPPPAGTQRQSSGAGSAQSSPRLG
ncbi:hypothetical protein JCM10212_003339 [Sporobolomyces blumeae]